MYIFGLISKLTNVNSLVRALMKLQNVSYKTYDTELKIFHVGVEILSRTNAENIGSRYGNSQARSITRRL